MTKLHGRFAPCFGRRECREHALGYLAGIASGRSAARASSRWPWSSAVPRRTSRRSNKASPWRGSGSSRSLLGRLRTVQQEIQAVFNEEFVPTASQSPIGTVGVIDGSGFVKHGPESVWRAAPMVRPRRQEGELPGGRVSPRRDSGGQRPAGPSTVPAGDVGCGRSAAKEDARSVGDHVPDETADRRRAGGAELPCVSTGSRPTRNLDATAIFSTPWKAATSATWSRCPRTRPSGPISLCDRRRTSSSGK